MYNIEKNHNGARVAMTIAETSFDQQVTVHLNAKPENLLYSVNTVHTVRHNSRRNNNHPYNVTPTTGDTINIICEVVTK